tara:strand:+ start:3764 stop:4639 length:876 start_codon:yes stop_codon:yes gene_type:complete
MSDLKETSEKKDYLAVDDPIPGQNYVCMSFVSPEKLIQDFKGFQLCKFLQGYCKEQELKYDEVYSKYEDYIYKYSEELERDFNEKNEYKTSMRGVKVRGVFNTKEEAENKAKSISRTDSTFNVFVGQVGYWLPWDPCADNVEKEVFQNEQLNELMEGYEKNNVNREIFYEELKQDKIQAAKDEYMAAKKKRLEEEREKLEENPLEEITDEKKSSDEDISDASEKEKELALNCTDQSSPTKEEEKVEDNLDFKINEDIEKSMDEVDPWMARKMAESADNSADNPADNSEKKQ